MTFARTLTVAVLVLVTASAGWAATVTGTVESVSDRAAMVRVDDGGVFTVNLGKLPADERARLKTGDRVVLSGDFMAAVTFQAVSVSAAPAALRGVVTSVQGNTVLLRALDGATYTVELAGAQSSLGRAPQAGDRLIVTGSYAGSATVEAWALLGSVQPIDLTRELDGAIEGLMGTKLALRSTAGEVWTVDISEIDAQQRQALRLGEQVRISGTRASGPLELMARSIAVRSGGFIRDIFRR